MSLLRLLAAGSSLKGLRDRPCPYKMTQQNLLPKFGQEKPGETTPVAAPESPSAAQIRPDQLKQGGRTTLPAWRVVRVLEQRECASPTPAVLIMEQTEAQMNVAEEIAKKDCPLAAKVKRPGGGLFQRLGLNPFRPKPAGRKTAAPVQGELRLEAVRVIRNDLSETDLEIIPAAKKAEETVAPPAAGVNPEATRLVWRRVAARLFGAGRT